MITKVSHMTLYVLDQDKAYDVYVNKLGFKVNTDMKMDNGFRWLTVMPPDQPGLEIILAEPKPPMFDEAGAQAVRTLLVNNALGGGVWEADNCQKTYEELKAFKANGKTNVGDREGAICKEFFGPFDVGDD